MRPWESIKDLIFNSHLERSLNSIFDKKSLPEPRWNFLKLTFIFCPENLASIDERFDSEDLPPDNLPKSIQLTEKRIDYYFLKYLCHHVEFFNKLENYSDKSISDIYQGIKQIL
jgi:hypothetical protein